MPLRLIRINAESISLRNFGVNLMLELFGGAINPNCNVTGRACAKGPVMESLDPERVLQIHHICLSYVESTNQDILISQWREIRNFMLS